MDSTTRATMFERLRDGDDPLAWEEFFNRYWRLIFAFSRRLGCSEHTSEEIVQDVTLAMFKQREVFQYDRRKGCFRNWLCTVVRNLVEKHRGRAAERIRAAGDELPPAVMDAEASDASPDAAMEAAFEESMLVVLLNLVRQEVSPQTYQAFELTALYGIPGARAAAMTGLSRDAVYAARSRVLARLRELGAPYRDDGRLTEQIQQAWSSLPDAVAEASLAARLGETMRSA
jgi:RNA polymerase sigma-70 factor (ECF subfamily)